MGFIFFKSPKEIMFILVRSLFQTNLVICVNCMFLKHIINTYVNQPICPIFQTQIILLLGYTYRFYIDRVDRRL